MGIFGGLDVFAIAGKVAVFRQRLGAQLNPVHQKDDFVGIFWLGNELRWFKAGHGFARACGVPHITA